ncbi:MAG: ribose 5-phosphate isomerase B [Terriglobia bacterium]
MPRKRSRRTRLALGADHNGVALKRVLVRALRHEGYPVRDLGTFNARSVDYPDVARRLGRAILSGRADLGILLCGSGVGASVAANKIPGIRAGLCQDAFSARQSREDDDTNILCLGAFVVGERLALELVHRWLGARFSGAARHRRRLRKVARLEKEAGCLFPRS